MGGPASHPAVQGVYAGAGLPPIACVLSGSARRLCNSRLLLSLSAMPLHTPIEPFGAWQEGAMKNVADHFRPQFNVDGLGLPHAAGYLEVVRGQQYQHLPTRNFSEPSDIGRIIQPSSISTEFGCWPAG